ncbi:uncharacterized protein LOC127951921 [Carassius gibelio]|uniref:uncharacterized protein LOC127951921 n=1 Tax=Carassius gibelio TaxID=101364 RepID=UPI002278D077|nr:uncharacterized protein LOC127951921 [Carassius gibelio]
MLSRVRARITLQDINYRHPIIAAERLSIYLRTIAFSYRIGVSTVCQIVPQLVTAIWDCLVEDYMAVPTTDDWRSIAEGFQERWNFPLCCGVVDGKASPNSGSQFHFSIVLLAVVDAKYRFRVIDAWGYGRTSDSGILANSAFGQALRARTLHLPADQPLPGAEERGPQPHVFMADEAFPLRRNLMRPFPGRTLPPERHVFSYCHQSQAGGGERLCHPLLTVEDVSAAHRDQP